MMTIASFEKMVRLENNNLLVDIHKCSKCGGDHKRVPVLQSFLSDRLYWAMCPSVHKLVAVVEK